MQNFGQNTVIINSSLYPEGRRYCPFSLKMETFLRIHRLRYVVTNKFIHQFIIYDGKVYEDVDEAIEAISIKNSINMNMHLDLEQLAVARLFQRMFENHFHWLILVKRWIHDNGNV